MYPFDVPKEGRSLIAIRSLIYCFGLMMFIKSMEFLPPVVAFGVHGVGLYSVTTIDRVWHRSGKERIISIACIKFIVVALLLL